MARVVGDATSAGEEQGIGKSIIAGAVAQAACEKEARVVGHGDKHEQQCESVVYRSQRCMLHAQDDHGIARRRGVHRDRGIAVARYLLLGLATAGVIHGTIFVLQ